MRPQEDSVPISQLAEVAVCERRLHLMLKHGERTSAEREVRLREGSKAHEATAREQSPDAQVDKRCFIATSVFGESAPETEALRKFRDARLMKTGMGRMAVKAYYTMSPLVARACDRSEWTRKVVRVWLRHAMKVWKV